MQNGLTLSVVGVDSGRTFWGSMSFRFLALENQTRQACPSRGLRQRIG